MALVQSESKRTRPRRTFTMDDEAFERLTLLSEDADTSRSRLLELLVGYDHEAYERLMQLATSAAVSPGEYLEQRRVVGERNPYERLTNMAAAGEGD